MLRRTLSCWMVLIGTLNFAAALQAQPTPPATGSGTDCCELVGTCANLKDDQLLDRTRYGHSLGMCYWHDRTTCPNCACPYYLKIASRPFPSGFDGGTGCLESLEEVVANLRQLCADGRCCCPRKELTGECPSQDRVWARDPLTGSCCQYANPCLAPDGWPLFPSEGDCRGGYAPPPSAP
ncbi:MAG TPA: hypothetical protein PK413_08395 [Thermoanaerobaculia bacterium]|nr:hypothetical protein [Thermoanaerobaculia bacterium]